MSGRKGEPLIPEGQHTIDTSPNFRASGPQPNAPAADPVDISDPAVRALIKAIESMKSPNPQEKMEAELEQIQKIRHPPARWAIDHVCAIWFLPRPECDRGPPVECRATLEVQRGKVTTMRNDFRFQGDGWVDDLGKPDAFSLCQHFDHRNGEAIGLPVVAIDPKTGFHVWPAQVENPERRKQVLIVQLWHRSLKNFSGRKLDDLVATGALKILETQSPTDVASE